MPTNISQSLGLLALPIGALLCACSRHAVDLGDNTAPQSVAAPETRCGASGIVPDAVVVKNQADLDSLAGCESIAGGLQIQGFRDIDLSPLGSLRSVAGLLDIQDASAGWLDSLHGLEALEKVGGLNIWNTKANSLEPLSHLENLDYSPITGGGGGLSLHGNDYLKDLHGLEAAQGLRSIDFESNGALESLSGLIVPPSLDRVNITNCRALTDIDALTSTAAEATNPAPGFGGLGWYWTTLTLNGTGLKDLSALSSLQGVEDISIMNNPLLSDASGLSALTELDSLYFQRNALTAFPSLSNLQYSNVSHLDVLDEPELTKLAIDIPNGLDQGTSSLLDQSSNVIAIQPGSAIEIARCGKLQTIDVPSGTSSADLLAIHDDASLTNVTLASLRHLDYLVVDNNPKLTRLTLGSLQTVGTLEIVGNPELSTAEMSSLRTFDSTLNGNADDAPAP